MTVAGFNYDKSAATADRLIKRFGQRSDMKRYTKGTGPAHNPGKPTEQSFPVTIVPLPFGEGDGNEVGTLELSKERRFYLSPVNPETGGIVEEVKPDDTLTFEGYEWTIRDVAPLNPGGRIVLYQGRCKRA